MAPQPKHNWTDPTEKECLKSLFEQVASNPNFPNVKERWMALFKLFKQQYPDNLLAPPTIWYYGKKLSENATRVLPGQVPKPALFWNDQSRADLLSCLKEAVKAAKDDTQLALFEGFGGPTAYLYQKLTDIFHAIYPDFHGDLTKEVAKLRENKEFLKDITIDSVHGSAYVREIMKYWEIGYRNELKSPFSYCCYKCSRLLSNNRDKIAYDQDEKQDIPILRHYPVETIVFPYRKGDRLVRCKRCTGRSLLDVYPLVGPGEQTFPRPEVFEGLSPQDKGLLGLVGLFSNVTETRAAFMNLYEHRRGETNALWKDAAGYARMYVMSIQKPEDPMYPKENKVPFANPDKQRECLAYLKRNNPLYRTFLANMETIRGLSAAKTCPPDQDPAILVFANVGWQPARKGVSKADLLGDEEAGVILPNDAESADKDIIFENMQTALAHPNPDYVQAHQDIQKLTKVSYNDQDLEAKIWPHLFWRGTGSWRPNAPGGITRTEYIQWRLSMLWPGFRREISYSFYNLDYQTKKSLTGFNFVRVNVRELAGPIKAGDLRGQVDPQYGQYGQNVAPTIANSGPAWRQETSNAYAMTDQLGTPHLLVTVTDSPSHPKVQAMKDGDFDLWFPEEVDPISEALDEYYRNHYASDLRPSQRCEDVEENPHRYCNMPQIGTRLYKVFTDQLEKGECPVASSWEVVQCFFERIEFFRHEFIKRKNGPLGTVTDYFMRVEYQKRGGLHVHMVLWVTKDEHGNPILPKDVISAEMPRIKLEDGTDHPCNEIFRSIVRAYQIHKCSERCHSKRVKNPKCKYGFSDFKINEEVTLTEDKVRYLYVRREEEDLMVSPHNLALLMFWMALVNVQLVTVNGWILYLCKYITKGMASDPVGLKDMRESHQPKTSEEDIPVIPAADENAKESRPSDPTPAPVASDPTPAPAAAEEDKPAAKLELSEKTKESNVRRFLRGRLVNSLEAITILLGIPHVYRSRFCTYLPIETKGPGIRILKRIEHRKNMPSDSLDIYYNNKFEKYLQRPIEFRYMTYRQFYRECYYQSEKAYPAENLAVDDSGNDQESDEDPEDQREDDHQGSIVPGNLTQLSHAVSQDSVQTRGCLRETRTPRYYDLQGRIVRKRAGKEAVAYFANYSPYGDQIEEYCLAQMLEKLPVTETEHQDADGTVISHRFSSLKEPTGSYLQESINRGILDIEQHKVAFLSSIGAQRLPYRVVEDMAQNLLLNGGAKGFDSLEALMDSVAPGRKEMEEAHIRLLGDDAEFDDAHHVAARRPLESYVSTFTRTQGELFKYVTRKLEAKEQVLLFVTGPAGCGKSHLIHSFVAFCRENAIQCQKLATTGNAAFNIGGMTIHAFFRIDIDKNKSEIEKGSLQYVGLRRPEVFLIDEVSMLTRKVHNEMDRALRTHLSGKRLFGGRSIIYFGDPAQLPAIGAHIWWHDAIGRFEIAVLKETVRQKDEQFVALLNRMRIGKQTEGDLDTLRTRVVPYEKIPASVRDEARMLFPTLKPKTAFNNWFLEEMVPGEMLTFKAKDLDSDGRPVSTSTAARIEVLFPILKIPERVINLKIGCIVKLMRNISVNEGWVNGRYCRLIASSGETLTLAALNKPDLRLPLRRYKHQLSKASGAGQMYYREQFPIELGYASTVHTAQGLTLPSCIVDAKGFFASGQFYTAISRVRTLDQLYLTALEPESIIFTEEYRRLWAWMLASDVLVPQALGSARGPIPFVSYQEKKSIVPKLKFHADNIRDLNDSQNSEEERDAQLMNCAATQQSFFCGNVQQTLKTTSNRLTKRHLSRTGCLSMFRLRNHQRQQRWSAIHQHYQNL